MTDSRAHELDLLAHAQSWASRRERPVASASPATTIWADQLPLTLDFSDCGGRELTATPPLPLTMEGMPTGDAPVAGDVGYSAPNGVVSLHYSDIGYWNGSARLGRIDGDLSVLTGRSVSFPVTMERAD